MSVRKRVKPQFEEVKKNGPWQKGPMDLPFFIVVILLVGIGLLMLYTASYAYASAYKNDSFFYIKKQFAFAVLGIIVMIAVSKVNYKYYKRFVWLIYGVAIALLGVVMFMKPPAGFTQHRWFIVGPINFQPSEIGKFAIIIALSHYVSRNYARMNEFKYMITPLIIISGPICLLTAIEPHLSATVILVLLSVVIITVGGANLKLICTGGAVVGGGMLVAVLAFNFFDYAKERLTYWTDPWADLQGKGWQTVQSLYAIGSGGLMGQGFGQSTQKYLYVSEPQNDFIFSIVCEELGFVGAAVIIALFGFFIYRGFVIAMRAKDKFSSLVALGITVHVGLQVALNLLVVTKALPNTGISLPFFSYGGTSLIMLLGEMGVILSISRSTTVQKISVNENE